MELLSAVDFLKTRYKETTMKTLFRALAAAFCLANVSAATLELDGDLTWNITDPRCTFDLDGSIINRGTATGTLKLVLYATKNAFPSAGYVVGEQTLGALSSGFQFKDFRLKSTSKLPAISGTWNFTITIAEYTSTGWRNVMAVPTGTEDLVAGVIKGQKKWVIPTKAVVAPLAKLKKGDVANLTLRATGKLNQFPTGWRDNTNLSIKSKSSLGIKSLGTSRTSSYKYSVVKTTYNKKKVNTGKLVISNTKPASTVTIYFYFQGAKTGAYKSEETVSGGTETTWGTFKFQ